ncbi:MAG: polymer-forming cytoskeletal protein [Methanosarcina sp.]|uniref:polymer-forming cytoskeletal protein n=1 Tax=Methanosarcina sp. TaxID=2213 RepID=UPI002621E187|nr:polymer-forming cytoskeletal protein [Methanosarcina sp.]MDD3246646.1 polymer-forming cytoskeletal protein [Methanosarcina sp.]
MIIMGEGVAVSGDVVAYSDARIDMWSKMGGRVEVGRNAYLGEFVTIDGKLTVEGDLDVGKEVKINGGFEAKGWIVVRNPVPVIIFLLLYIREMMRLGKGEEVEKALEELFDDSEEDLESDGEPAEKILIIPTGTKISPDAIEVGGNAVIGNNCYLIGNLRAQSVETGKDLTFKGSVNSEGNITIGENSTIYGNLSSKGQVHIGRNTRVFGEIRAESVLLHENARVDGTIKAPSGVSFLREAGEKPVLADVNALGKVIPREIKGAVSQDGLLKALGIIEIDSLIKTNTKAKNGFVPGREGMSARTMALGRTRRTGGVRRLRRRRHEAGEHQS